MNLITSQLFLVLWKFCYSYFLNGLWWTVTRQFLDHWLFLFSDFLLVFHVFRKVQQSKSWSVNLLKISAGNSHCWKVFKKFLGKSGRPTAAVKALALRHFFQFVLSKQHYYLHIMLISINTVSSMNIAVRPSNLLYFLSTNPEPVVNRAKWPDTYVRDCPT